MGNFKLQLWKIKLEKWHETSNKSEITGFYTGKSSKITRNFSWGCFMQHRLQWFLWSCFWSPYFFNLRFVIERVAKLVLFVSVAEADDSPAPTLRSYLLSPLLSLLVTLGNSLPNSCVIDGCWFSSISHFAMFTNKQLHIFVDELTAWEVCVPSESKPNLLNLNVSIVC